MSEKSKWFKGKPKPDIRYFPTRFAASSSVSVAACTEFSEAVDTLHERGRLTEPSYNLFRKLCRLQPAYRLSLNLSTLLRILARNPVDNIIHEGLTEAEHRALVELEKLGAPANLKAVAQGLLNVYERNQLLEAAEGLFQEERCRKWRIPDG